MDRDQVLDLIETIRHDDALRDELRSVLLSQELLSLPERFSDFVAEMHEFDDGRITEVDAHDALLVDAVFTARRDSCSYFPWTKAIPMPQLAKQLG